MKFRLKEVEIDGYYFIGYEGLLWHSGRWWQDETELKIVYNNGSQSVLLYGVSKKSIKQLRKLAKPCKIKLLTEKISF
jgi:hypothetical protein